MAIVTTKRPSSTLAFQCLLLAACGRFTPCQNPLKFDLILMYESTWLHEQTRATRALLKFIRDHDSEPDADLVLCLVALEGKKVESAVQHARRVKPAGMDTITDWFPPVMFANEDDEYVTEVLVALVNRWSHLMSLSFKAVAR